MTEKYTLGVKSVGIISTNCYLFADNETGKMIVIDPGGEGKSLVKWIKDLKWTVSAIINTHGHADHIAANSAIKKAFGAKVYIHKDDAEYLLNPDLNGSSMMPEHTVCSRADVLLDDGAEIKVGTLTIKVIHTPGHTPGGICLACEDVLFTGDTLFRGDIGRTDLAGGDEEALLRSLKKISAYPPGTLIYPGHGPKSNMKHELDNNPYLR